MRIVLFGATGMVGQGVLRECLLAADVETVLCVGRTATGQRHAKLRELVRSDPSDLSDASDADADADADAGADADADRLLLSGFDACFFCLGVSSVGMSEADYRRVTFDLTLGAARTLSEANPSMTFVYVSGAGTDASERGARMWARVKGETENALLRLPFKAAVMFRPAAIVPLHGITSRTRLYRVFYGLARPLWPVLTGLFPQYVTTSEQVGRAMLRVAREGSPKPILETRDINAL